MTRPTLDAGQRRVLGRYLRVVADKLNLRDWTVSVAHSAPSMPEHQAEVGSDPGAWKAQFYFRDDTPELSADVVRATVVHELLHVHRRAIVHLNATALREELSSDRWNAWLSAYVVLDEMAIEAVALAIAPLMPPFPGWPKR